VRMSKISSSLSRALFDVINNLWLFVLEDVSIIPAIMHIYQNLKVE
jgi:hypothetical protein